MSEIEPGIPDNKELNIADQESESTPEVTEDEIAEYYMIDKKIAEMDFDKFSEMFQGATKLVKHVEDTYGPPKNYLLYHPIARSTVDAAIGEGTWPRYYDTPEGDFKNYIEQYINLEEINE